MSNVRVSLPPAQAPERKTPRIDPATHFSGEAEKLGFVTLNNGRFLANEIQADFIEVGYALKPCRNLTKETSSQCLYRRVQKLTDDDVTEGGTESVLLENVKQFKLRYIGEGKKEMKKSLSGEVPSPINPPSGCHFHPRCPFAMPKCSVDRPVLKQVGGQAPHEASCWLY